MSLVKTRYRVMPVWDITIRLCHWWMVITLLLLLPIGLLIFFSDSLGLSENKEEFLIDIHAYLGFFFTAGLLIRLAYMFNGPDDASWKDMLPITEKQRKLTYISIKFYLSGLKEKSPLYFAHNPLAGVAYIIFFISASMQVVTGTVMYLSGSGGWGNYADDTKTITMDNQWPPEWLTNIHLLGAIIVVIFIFSHLIALFIHDVKEQRGLASSMISGNKFFTEEEVLELSEQEVKTDDVK